MFKSDCPLMCTTLTSRGSTGYSHLDDKSINTQPGFTVRPADHPTFATTKLYGRNSSRKPKFRSSPKNIKVFDKNKLKSLGKWRNVDKRGQKIALTFSAECLAA